MRRRLQSYFVLAAWLLATGVQWDFVQVIAWSRMFTLYVQTMEFSDAVQLTFSGEMCQLCTTAQEGRQAQDGGTIPSKDAPKAKLLLFVQTAADPLFCITITDTVPLPEVSPLSLPRGAPPTPPPRFTRPHLA